MNKVIRHFGFACFILCVLLTVVDVCCLDRKFYAKEYAKIGNAEYIGVSDDDLAKMTEVLLGYLEDDNDDLIVYANVKGVDREVFNTKEKTHMVDVKNLYINAMTVRTFAGLLFVATIIYSILNKEQVGSYFVVYKNTLLGGMIIIGALAIAIATNFEEFWTTFHHVFFPGNDLWLLSMRTDILIMMVPEQFFFDLCTRIVLMTVSILFTALLVLYLARKKYES